MNKQRYLFFTAFIGISLILFFLYNLITPEFVFSRIPIHKLNPIEVAQKTQSIKTLIGFLALVVFIFPFGFYVAYMLKSTGFLASKVKKIKLISRINRYGEALFKEIKKIPLVAIPILLALLFFPLNGVHTSSDSALYINNALNMLDGHGYVDETLKPILYRGPIFSGLITISFYLFGVSVKHAFWVVRTFYIFNTVIIFLIGEKFYGKKIGMLAALLYLTSYQINNLSSDLGLDIVFPFFVLLYIFFLYLAIEKNSNLYFILSGFAAGIAFLTKELAILFFPLPFLCFIIFKAYRINFEWKGIIYFTVALLAILSPWLIYVYHSSGNFTSLSGLSSSRVVHSFDQSDQIIEHINFLSLIAKYTLPFLNYYTKYVANNFILSPLFAVSWLFLLVRAIISRKKQDLILILSFILFGPVFYFQGAKGWRSGQSAFFYILSFVVIAEFFIAAGNYLINRGIDKFFDREKCQKLKKICMVSLLTIVISFQLIGEKKTVMLWLGITDMGMSYYLKDDFRVEGWHGKELDLVGQWIQKNIPINSKLMIDWYWRSSLYYYTKGNYRLFRIPYRLYPKNIESGRQVSFKSIKRTKPLFIWPHKNDSSSDNYLRVLSEDDLLSEIRNKKTDYVILTYRRKFLTKYFEKNPGFEKLLDLDKIKIFKIHKINTAPGFITSFGTNTIEYFDRVEKRIPQKFRQLITIIIKELDGITADEITKARHGKYPMFMLYDEENLIKKSINAYQEALKQDPNNSSQQIILAELYRTIGNIDKAIEAYKNAIRLDSNNALYHSLYARLFQKLNLFDKAKELYQLAIQLGPENALCHALFADYYIDNNIPDNAIYLYEKAISFEPKNSKYRFKLASLYIQQHNLYRAIKEYLTVIYLGVVEKLWILRPKHGLEDYLVQLYFAPHNALRHGELAKAYAEAGDSNKAIFEYQVASYLDPDNVSYPYHLKKYTAEKQN